MHWYGFSQYEISYACQDYYFLKKLSHTGCFEMVSPQYESPFVYQNCSKVKKIYYNGCIDIVSPQYEFSYACQDY